MKYIDDGYIVMLSMLLIRVACVDVDERDHGMDVVAAPSPLTSVPHRHEPTRSICNNQQAHLSWSLKFIKSTS